MPSPADYLIRRGIQLQHASQNEEAIAVYREAVTVDPQANAAWLNLAMLLQQRGSAEAYAAFAQFLRTASADHPLIGLASTALRDAGHEVPASRHSDDASGQSPTVQFYVNSGGKRSFVIADNDSSVELDELLAALNKFIEADSWLDAYLVMVRYPELLSSLAHMLLEFRAGQRDDRQMAHQAQTNIAVLSRAREVGLLAAFAEADQSPTEEFGHLVRAKREIEPVLLGFNGLTLDELWQRLDDVPWLSCDDDTYLLLARHAESAGDKRRAVIESLRLMLERHARGEPTADDQADDHGPGEDRAVGLEQTAAAATDVTADQVARAGEELLARADNSLSAFWRVDIARTTAQCYLRFGVAASDLTALARADNVLAGVEALAVPGSWQDTVIAVTYANIAISRYETSGAESMLVSAADRLIAARGRVGRYRTAEAPLLRALASISTLRAEQTGDIKPLREAVELLTAAERITLRHGMPWLVNQAALAKALLALAGQGEADALSRCDEVVDDLRQRFGDQPGMRGQVWEMAGRLASSRYQWTEDVADLDTAVQCYQAALHFPETVPVDRAHLQSNLAFALWRRHQASSHADDLEHARQYGEAALSGLPVQAPMTTRVRRNLARVYTTLNTDEHDRRAADLLRIDLRVLPIGPDRAVAALNLALTLLRMAATGRTAREETLTEAYTAYAEGVGTLDPELRPWESVQFGEAFGSQFLARGEWQAATLSFALALDGIEALAGLTPARQWWEEFGRRLDGIVQLGAFCAGRAGLAEQAVTWLEGHRTRAMRHALRLDTSALTALAAAGHDELARAYTTRADEIRYAGRELDESNHSFLGRRRRLLREQLDQLAQRIRATPGFDRFGVTPDVEGAYSAATDSTLLYVAVTPLGGLAFMVDGTDRSIQTVELPAITTDTVTSRANSYLAALDAYRADTSNEAALRGWLGELDGVRDWLWTALVQSLADEAAAHRPVTFIPSGLLGLLPVTAAESADSGQQAIGLTDWRFAPSADALIAARRSAERADRIAALAVLDPQPTDFAPLLWTEVEAAALRAQTGNLTRLTGPNATTADVLREMPNHTTLHFSCHGNAYLNQPLDSYLALAEHAKLTIGTLTDEGRLWGARLCFLSACDSGVAGTTAPQEVVALPSTLIQLGAAAVVASQWPVSDVAAAVLAVRFYQACGDGLPPATAFAQAQRWLRTATRSEVSSLLRRHGSDVPDLGRLIADLPFVRTPFSHARDWAAFTYTGC